MIAKGKKELLLDLLKQNPEGLRSVELEEMIAGSDAYLERWGEGSIASKSYIALLLGELVRDGYVTRGEGVRHIVFKFNQGAGTPLILGKKARDALNTEYAKKVYETGDKYGLALRRERNPNTFQPYVPDPDSCRAVRRGSEDFLSCPSVGIG